MISRNLLVLTLVSTPAVAQTLTPAQIKRVDSVFARFDGTNRPGCAVGVGQGGQEVYARGYGMADLQNGVPIAPTSIFHVASVSKQFASFAIALLAKDGKLSLDDDIHKYVPEIPDYGKKITIRNLMYHTSGIRDQWELLGLAGWRYPEDLFTQDDVLDILSRQKALNFNPGDEWVYSNSGYTLIAIIVKRVSGKTLREFSDERIFKPLGMNRTHVHDDHAMIVPGRTSAYEEANGVWKISIPDFDTHGATSLFTTVEDLLKWQHNFETATVGGRELLREAETSVILNNGKPANYGFGISTEVYRGARAFGHGGADAGYRADVVRFPDHGLAIAVTCNFAEATPNLYSRAVADILLGDKLEAPRAAATTAVVPVSPSRLQQVAGVYKSPVSDQAFRLTVKDGKLVVENFGAVLEPINPNRFQFAGINLEVDGPADGTPTMLRMLQGSLVFDSMKRAPAFVPKPASLADYAGDYWSDELRVSYRIELKDTSLVLHRFKAGIEPLVPTYEDAFMAGQTGTLRFTSTNGKVTGFRVTGGRVRNIAFTKGRDHP